MDFANSQLPERFPAQAGPFRGGGARAGRDGCAALPGVLNGMDFATTRGRTGFDGDAEAGIAGEGAQPSKNGHSL